MDVSIIHCQVCCEHVNIQTWFIFLKVHHFAFQHEVLHTTLQFLTELDKLCCCSLELDRLEGWSVGWSLASLELGGWRLGALLMKIHLVFMSTNEWIMLLFALFASSCLVVCCLDSYTLEHVYELCCHFCEHWLLLCCCESVMLSYFICTFHFHTLLSSWVFRDSRNLFENDWF